MEPSWNIDTDEDGLINVLDVDSDNDGVIDGVDIDPLHDLLVKVEITHVKIEDPIDWGISYKSYTVKVPYLSCTWRGCRIRYKSITVEYPVEVRNKRAEPYFKVRIPDQWDSDLLVHSEVPLANDVEDYSFSDPPIFMVNVPDYLSGMDIHIEAWDEDVGGEDMLDISGHSGVSPALPRFNLGQAAKNRLENT